jgi:hypothetical protein
MMRNGMNWGWCRSGVWLAIVLAAAVLAPAGGGQSPALAQAAVQPSGEAATQPSAEAPKEASTTTPANGAPATNKGKKASSKTAKGEKSTKSAARLPAYFSAVVTEEQRQKIHSIQNDYAGRIEPLRRQLDSLTKERDDKINATLTPEQKQKIEALKAAAKKAKPPKKDAKKSTDSAAKPDQGGPAKPTQ